MSEAPKVLARNTPIWRSWPVAIALLFVILGYFPTLTHDYVPHDQWRAFRYQSADTPIARAKACISTDVGYYTLTARPLIWMTECIEQAAVWKISDFRRLRPFALAILLITVVALVYAMTPIMGLHASSAAAAAFALTPGISFMYYQSLPAGMVLMTPGLAALSFMLFDAFQANRRYDLKRALASLALFIVACMIYPSYAFIVLPLALLRFLFSYSDPMATRLRGLARTITFFFFASLLYYAISKLVIFTFFGTVDQSALGDYEVKMQLGRGAVAHQTVTAISYFLKMAPLNFTAPPATCFVIILIFCVVFAWMTTKGKNSFFATALGVAILFSVTGIILLGSISPWFFSKTADIAARHVVPWNLFFSAVIFGGIALFLRTLADEWRATIILFVIFSPLAWSANFQSQIEIATSNLEIQFLRERLATWISDRGWQTRPLIVAVLPGQIHPRGFSELLAPRFGNNNAVLSSSQNPVGIPWMIRAVLRENPSYEGGEVVECQSEQACIDRSLAALPSVIVSYVQQGDHIVTATDPFIINFSELTDKVVQPDVEIVKIDASTSLPGLGPRGLLSSSPPGWHAAKNPIYPQNLVVNFSKPRSFHRLGLLNQDNLLDRMPNNFTISTSPDGVAWTVISENENVCSQPPIDGWRYVSFKEATSQFVRIEINANCGNPNLLTLRGLRFD